MSYIESAKISILIHGCLALADIKNPKNVLST